MNKNNYSKSKSKSLVFNGQNCDSVRSNNNPIEKSTLMIENPIKSIAGINFEYDKLNNTNSISSTGDMLSIGINDYDTLVLSNNGNVVVSNDLQIGGTISTINGHFAGDIEADNINLLGDIISSNANFTGDINATFINTSSARVLENFVVDGQIVTNSLAVGGEFSANFIETKEIISLNDLNISAGPNRTINIPNLRYRSNIDNIPIIGVEEIKSAKIFVVNRNVLLQADVTCDGIEIIIYNNGPINLINVRDPTKIICTIANGTAIKLLYIHLICKWVKIV